MRCMIKLKSLANQQYNPAYHSKLQGVLYKILKRAGYGSIHDNSPFKYVSFSNIFPPEDMKEGDQRNWIIASPNNKIIESISKTISSMDRIEPGDHQYKVNDYNVFELSPEKSGEMITGTPIVVRMSPEKCDDYGIDPGKYDQVYWRLDHNSKAFIDEIEKNLASKYERYYDREAPERPYFTSYSPKKEVSVPLKYEDGDVTVIGTLWKLEYEANTREMRRIIRMAYGAGLGELNTTGFGFMNKVE